MNSRKKSSAYPLDKVSEKGLPHRVADLERQVATLLKDVATLKDLSGSPFFGAGTEEEEVKPGPKEKIDDVDLFHNRDALILWLEPVWPWLEGHISGGIESVERAFEAVAESADLRPKWQQRLLRNVSSLQDFLGNERSGKTMARTTVIDALNLAWEDERRKRAANKLPPRRIANAMAGVPDIAWRTSLDRCSADPSQAVVAINLDMYLRENYRILPPTGRDLTGLSCPLPRLRG